MASCMGCWFGAADAIRNSVVSEAPLKPRETFVEVVNLYQDHKSHVVKLYEADDDAQTSTETPTERTSNDTVNSTEMRLLLAARMTKRIRVDNFRDSQFAAPAIVDKTEDSQRLIMRALKRNIAFEGLTDADRLYFAERMASRTMTEGTEVVRQGDINAEYFHVVETGSFAIRVNGTTVSSAGPGDSFGELALLFDAPRAATVVCTERGVVWMLERHCFQSGLASMIAANTMSLQETLRSMELFEPLADAEVEQLAEATQRSSFQAGELVIQKGDEGRMFYIVHSGSVRVTDLGDGSFAMLAAGEFFGERALLTGAPRAGTVAAETDVELLCLTKEDFDTYVADLPLLARQPRLQLLRRISALSPLSAEEQATLADKLAEVDVAPGESVFEQGDDSGFFYIIKKGHAQVWQQNGATTTSIQIGELGQAQYFGESALLGGGRRNATIRASGEMPLELLKLAKADVEKVLGPKANLIEQQARLRALEARRCQEKVLALPLTLNDLTEISPLAMGSFSKVCLRAHATSGATFAVKAINKDLVDILDQRSAILNERDMLLAVDHPFVVRLFKTFADEHRVYFLTEFLQGGDLASALREPGRGGNLAGKSSFYSAVTLLGLGHLHELNIVHRDLRSGNIMLDETGYPKIIDLGSSKRIEDKSFTLCGSHEYMSPEMVLGMGHDRAVDYWALGVLIFEMITGHSPFVDPTNPDPERIMWHVCRGPVIFPSGFPAPAASIVKALLRKEPRKRLGMQAGGHGDIAKHAFFADLDLDALSCKEIPAPWIPTLASPSDVSRFRMEEIEDIFDSPEAMETEWDAVFRM